MNNDLALDKSVNGWMDAFAAWLVAGAGAGGGFFAIRWLLEYFAGRFDKRTDQLDASTARLITSLESQVKSLVSRLATVENELVECKHNHSVSEARVLKLEALFEAAGEGRQLAALIVAHERTEEKK